MVKSIQPNIFLFQKNNNATGNSTREKKYKTVLNNKPVLIADNIIVEGTSFTVLEVK